MLKKNKSLENMTVLVTGGAGFIGSHLTKALVKEGYKVRVLDNIIRNVNNVADLSAEGKIEFLKGDIRNNQHVREAMADVDYVFHEAAVCLNRCLAFPAEAIEVNLEGSYNVFEAAIRERVEKVIYASSASVYGEPKYLPMDEEHSTIPLEPYAAAKLCTDHFAKFLAEKNGMNFIALRYFNVYGPNQSTDAYYTSVVNSFIKRVLAGASPLIAGKGDQALDFTYVDDIVQANIAALRSDVENEIFNVGYGSLCSIKQLASTVLKLIGSDLEPEFFPRTVPISKRQCDISKIDRFLGFKCRVGLESGLKKLIEHIKSHPGS